MNPHGTVLVVDDEKPLRDFVRHNLEARGFRVLVAANGMDALSVFHAETVDLVILDIMMPQLDGLETTRRIRQESIVPIIILTALGEESDKVRAFDYGADDYLTKPFGLGELLGRIKAVLRRAHWSEPSLPNEVLHHRDLVVELEQHSARCGDRLLDLTPTEFNLLVYLMKNAGKVLTHKSILQNVWGPEYGDEPEYLRVYMGRLRQLIEPDAPTSSYILTERGIGYRFG